MRKLNADDWSLSKNSRRSRLHEKRRSVRNVNAVKKRKRSSRSQDAKGKWKSVSDVKRSSVSVRKEPGSERRKSSSAAALDLLWISRSARMKMPCLQALCQSMSPLRSLQKRRKKHNSNVSRERRERERAERLKAERESFENKNINEIFKEYSKNPYYMANVA